MYLVKIEVKNYRLLTNAELELDHKTTLIVGRNNSAKTSCFSCIYNALKGRAFAFNDYPLNKRHVLYDAIDDFMAGKIDAAALGAKVDPISVKFVVDYSNEDQYTSLGALSPFIIDLDESISSTEILVEYRLKTNGENLKNILELSYAQDRETLSNQMFTSEQGETVVPLEQSDKNVDLSNECCGSTVQCITLHKQHQVIDASNNTSKIELQTGFKVLNEEPKVDSAWSDKAHIGIASNFNKLFETVIYAVNPKDSSHKVIRSQEELCKLFPCFMIPAERDLGESEGNRSSLATLISDFFESDELDPKVAAKLKELKSVIAEASYDIQQRCCSVLDELISQSNGFGYPNFEELRLSVASKLSIDEQIKNQTQLVYMSSSSNESLPDTHNGLGFKNLIKIEFLLKVFATNIKKQGDACIPLLFIEEPESHMHPQMQQLFAANLQKFIDNITSQIKSDHCDSNIQILMSSHSSSIVCNVNFANVRYMKRQNSSSVKFVDMAKFVDENINFVKKYLTVTKCELFFADKVVLVEGASERLLLPDMISKFAEMHDSDTKKFNLPYQYCSIVEIGGAYAHKFIPFIEFLDIPCLILTDLDPMKNGVKSETVVDADKSSNATIKWWIRRTQNLKSNAPISMQDILSLSSESKTIGKCHIEFQTQENGLCGRSLEESIKNVNRKNYNLSENISEEQLIFKGSSKTEFALDLLCSKDGYNIPKYIMDGLEWLDKQKVFEDSCNSDYGS